MSSFHEGVSLAYHFDISYLVVSIISLIPGSPLSRYHIQFADSFVVVFSLCSRLGLCSSSLGVARWLESLGQTNISKVMNSLSTPFLFISHRIFVKRDSKGYFLNRLVVDTMSIFRNTSAPGMQSLVCV